MDFDSVFGDETPGRYCNYDGGDQSCDWNNYIRDVCLLLIPGVVLGGGTLVFAGAFWLFCRCQLGSTAIPWRIVLIILVSLNIFLLLAVIGVEGAVEEAGERWLDDTLTWVDDYYDELNGGISYMSSLPYYSGNVNETLSYISKAGEVKDKVFEYRSVVQGAQIGRFVFVVCLLLTVIVLYTCGAIVALIGEYRLVMAFGIGLLVFVVPVWLLFSWELISDALFQDICKECSIEKHHGASALRVGLFPCKLISNNAFATKANETLSNGISKTCTEYDSFCSNYSTALNCIPCTDENIPYLMDNTTVLQQATCNSSCFVDGCNPQCNTTCYSGYCMTNQTLTLHQCNVSCVYPALKSAAGNFSTYADTYLVYFKIYLKTFKPFFACGYARRYCVEVCEDTICGPMRFVGVVAFLVMLAGLAMIIITMVAGWTSKVMLRVGDEEFEMQVFGDKGGKML